MSIAPVLHSIEVKAPPARAFELFTSHMGKWWPKGKTLGTNVHADILIEPHPGGRWYERDAEGNETHWGRVLAWEPPERVLLGWQINAQWRHDPDFLTEVELSFAALAGGGTRVTLEHRNLERYGADAEDFAGKLRGGWPTLVGHFAHYTASQA
ncbi:MAG TPA: SRPBCC family protein [Steroidobacteraceae bacterium]|nr:SRPBCC family protein [Steroidobacteraceae bacterium]